MPDELIFLTNRNLKQKKSTASMRGKTVVLTGATSGVGLETLKCLAQGGAHVIMVVRNLEKAQKVQTEILERYSTSVDVVIADFSDLSDVRNAAETILNSWSTIDVVINCAGLHSTTRILTKEGHELVFCVNHLASFLLTQLLLDRLIQNAPTRIIQVNSEGHRFGGLDLNDLDWHRRRYAGLKGYGASKIAQLLTVWEMADRLKGTGVTINAVHPGDVKTGIGSNNGWLYRFFSKHVTQRFLRDPHISGEAIYYLAADPEMTTVSGKFYHLTVEEKPARHALDRQLSKKVYTISMQMTGLWN